MKRKKPKGFTRISTERVAVGLLQPLTFSYRAHGQRFTVRYEPFDDPENALNPFYVEHVTVTVDKWCDCEQRRGFTLDEHDQAELRFTPTGDVIGDLLPLIGPQGRDPYTVLIDGSDVLNAIVSYIESNRETYESFYFSELARVEKRVKDWNELDEARQRKAVALKAENRSVAKQRAREKKKKSR